MPSLTAAAVVKQLKSLGSAAERKKIEKFFDGDTKDNRILGVRMKHTFDTAKVATEMPLDQVELLLAEPYYEARLAAVSVLDFKARKKHITDVERKALYDTYLGNHDRINDWGMVDRAAPHVVGGYLIDRSRKPLEKLAKSKDVWRRRTAITAPLYFVRYGQPSDMGDVFKIAALLVHDSNDYVNKAVGIALKHAGTVDQPALLDFLDQHIESMPNATRRYALEKLPVALKKTYLRPG